MEGLDCESIFTMAAYTLFDASSVALVGHSRGGHMWSAFYGWLTETHVSKGHSSRGSTRGTSLRLVLGFGYTLETPRGFWNADTQGSRQNRASLEGINGLSTVLITQVIPQCSPRWDLLLAGKEARRETTVDSLSSVKMRIEMSRGLRPSLNSLFPVL